MSDQSRSRSVRKCYINPEMHQIASQSAKIVKNIPGENSPDSPTRAFNLTSAAFERENPHTYYVGKTCLFPTVRLIGCPLNRSL